MAEMTLEEIINGCIAAANKTRNSELKQCLNCAAVALKSLVEQLTEQTEKTVRITAERKALAAALHRRGLTTNEIKYIASQKGIK